MATRRFVIRLAVAAAALAAAVVGGILATSEGPHVAVPATPGAQLDFAGAPAATAAVSARGSFASPFAATPVVRTAIPALSPPLRDLPAVGPVQPRPEVIEPPEVDRAPAGPELRDPVVQKSFGADAMPTPIQTFEGLRNRDNLIVAGRSARPPDSEGDVGPNHYVEWINVLFRIFDKSGTPLTAPVLGNAVFQNLPADNVCRTTNQGDPLVNYDQLADRWVLSQFAFNINAQAGAPVPPFHQCVAVSTTPDPTGTYCTYSFLVSAENFNDYGKMGVWPDGYYFSYAAFAGGTAYVGPAVHVVERPKMIAQSGGSCQAAQSLYFDPTNLPTLANQKRMLPSDLDGSTPPPPGRPNFFMASSSTNNTLQLWKFAVTWTPAAVGTFLKNTTEIPVPAYDPTISCLSSRQCIPQKDETNRLDTVPDRLMYELNYRNFGSDPPPGVPANTESLVTNETVDANDPSANHAGVRWYEIRDPNGTPVAFQASTFAPDAHHRWMASAAQDVDGNLAVGYSVSSTSLYPAIRWGGRLATDPVGQLTQGEASMFEGLAPAPTVAAPSTSTANARWGDYSRLTVDPMDDCTFWYINEYHEPPVPPPVPPPDPLPPESDPRQWVTRIGSFKFPGCGRPTAVRIASFGARWKGRRVEVSWKTASEVDAVGFNVFRATAAGPFRKVNAVLVRARHAGSSRSGAYRFVDRAVRRSATYTYRLQLVDAQGKLSWHGVGSAPS